MGTSWDARTYDESSAPQQAWASDVLARLDGIRPDATVLDVGCGTGRVTERLLDLDLDEPVDAIVSTATLHWVRDHDRLWPALARALKPGGVLEIQCGGQGNIAGAREAIDAGAAETAPELVGWSPWTFAGPPETERRLHAAGLRSARCWLEDRPTDPHDPDAFVRTSILPAHLARLAPQRREAFAAAVMAHVRLPLDYVRLNASARR